MRCASASLLLLFAAWVGPAQTPAANPENALREQARLSPESFPANRALAEYYVQRHDLSAAIPWLEKAWRADPSNYDNGYDLALACLQTGKTARSREVIAALLQKKDRAELHNLLGDVEEAEAHVPEAAAQYELAARMDPTEKNLFDLGSDLVLHGGFEPALKVFVFGAGRYPGSARLRVGLGIAHYSLGQYDEAVETLCQAVDLNPKDTQALAFLGKMYDVSPRYADEVTDRLSRFARLYPDNAAANYYYAMSLRKRTQAGGPAGSQAQAEALLLRAVKLDPEMADAHFELGLLYEDEKQEAKAIHEYEIATRLRADLQKAHYHLGRLYQKSGQEALARKEFQAFESLKTKR